MGIYLGILVSSFVFNKIRKQIPTHEFIEFYEDACTEYGFTPCFFRINDIVVKQENMKALVRVNESEYRVKVISRPKVIHNRGLGFQKIEQKKIEALKNEGVMIFNECTRYEKLEIHKLLMNNNEIKPHLPVTLSANINNFYQMLLKHKEILIKPSNGTFGKDIIKITQKNNDIWLYKNLETEQLFSINKTLPSHIENIVKDSKYIIQQRIQLATYQGCPFDIRVSVQKNHSGIWQISGIVAKVAKKGMYVTNVASGGKCYPLEIIVKNKSRVDINHLKRNIEKFALLVCEHLEKHLRHFADVGLDIGLTNDGFPMFIECNCRDLRYSFKEAGLIDEWKSTFYTPVGYANYLLKNK